DHRWRDHPARGHGGAGAAGGGEAVRAGDADLRPGGLHQRVVRPARAAGRVSERLRTLAAETRSLEERLRQGGGADKIERQHSQGKLTARERIDALCDPASRFLEVGLLVAYDQYDGQAPAAGVVTGVAMVAGREV